MTKDECEECGSVGELMKVVRSITGRDGDLEPRIKIMEEELRVAAETHNTLEDELGKLLNMRTPLVPGHVRLRDVYVRMGQLVADSPMIYPGGGLVTDSNGVITGGVLEK